MRASRLLLKLALPVILGATLTAASLYGAARYSLARSPGKLREELRLRKLGPLTAPTAPRAQVELGKVLFFDKLLSGNRDVACATCHSPNLGSGDASAVSIGTGGVGLGRQRQLARARLINRNSLPLYNRGDPGWRRFFWDGRAEAQGPGNYSSPLGQALPEGLESLLAAQALFPLSSRNEMRGKAGDKDVFGLPNDLAPFDTRTHSPEFWERLMGRVLTFDEYRRLFQDAYPEARGHFGVSHLLNALAAYEAVTFTTVKAPFARFLAGDNEALSESALAGARLFYGKANCDVCHSGTLMTDQDFHNLAVPQVGPGGECITCHAETVPHKSRILAPGETPDHRHVRENQLAPRQGGDNLIASNIDWGRFSATGKQADRFRFRTPSLWNVAHTGPYMHNGCYGELRRAVEHHLKPADALKNYQPEGLDPRIAGMVMRDAFITDILIQRLDPKMAAVPALTKGEVGQLVNFLEALSEPDQELLRYRSPERVPSGLKEEG